MLNKSFKLVHVSDLKHQSKQSHGVILFQRNACTSVFTCRNNTDSGIWKGIPPTFSVCTWSGPHCSVKYWYRLSDCAISLSVLVNSSSLESLPGTHSCFLQQQTFRQVELFIRPHKLRTAQIRTHFTNLFSRFHTNSSRSKSLTDFNPGNLRQYYRAKLSESCSSAVTHYAICLTSK
jgi:hypothetical protein